MTLRVRPAHGEDFKAIYQMAKLTGGGFTNLPADRATLVAKLARSEKSFARKKEEQAGDLYVFVLEDMKARKIRGTCQVFGQVGVVQPFYSYHLSTLTQSSPELGKTFRNQTLTLTTDLEGSSEVGGLFLHPEVRAGGWGSLLARSRYLFIKQHRARFGPRVLAELRGVMDQAGNAPFWDALAGRFFGMTFPEADEFNAVHGTKFIADLMPKTPIYVSLLAESGRAVMGLPHPSGRAALRMLEEEGFTFDRYIDIFDGGPTVTAATDNIRTIRESECETVCEIGDGGKLKMIVAAGRLKDFRACSASVKRVPKHGICIDQEAAELLEVKVGDQVIAVPPLMALTEINFDGIIGPSHNYAGLSLGNLASQRNAGEESQPRAAALQGVDKMRANLALGLAQGVFLPHPRPDRAWLAELGTTIKAAEPAIAANALSASAMWAANAATVSPAPDAGDRRCHLTVANLRTMAHRSHEWPATLAQLQLAFADAAFKVHGPIPPAFGDEGAANHMRLTPRHGEPGVEIFVYGVSGGSFPARQHLEASRAIARRHRLDPERTLFAEQSEEAIAAGAFHNDVVAVANERVLFGHQKAFADKAALIAACELLVPGFEYVEVADADVPLADAIRSYLFNAQLVTLPGGEMILIAPTECRETPAVWSWIERHIAGNGPIRRVEIVDVRQSMANGGGPACLRLRVVADPASVDPRFLVDDARLDAIAEVIRTSWPVEIRNDELQNPALIRDIEAARTALLGALDLSELG